MLIRLKNGEILKATKISSLVDGGVNSYLVEDWEGGVHEFYTLAIDEVDTITGKDGLKSWDVL